MASRLWIGRSSSTCGRIVRTPLARGSKPSKRRRGLSQISRRHERCSRSISNDRVSSASRSSPSVMRSTTAPCPSTRRAQRLLNSAKDVAMRVPPAQSATLAPQAASASSGSRWRIERVTLVSRVPNRKVVTRFSRSVTACRKCRKSRVYWLIEPEISRSATIGGSFCRGPTYFRSMTAPPAFMLARKVRRTSMMWPWRDGARRRVRTSSNGSARRAIASFACAISAAVICAKSFFCSTSRSETVSRASISSCSSRSGWFMPAKSASWMRCAPASGGLGADGRVSGSMAASIFSIRPRRRKKMRKAWSNRIECSRRFTNTACSVQ